MTSPTPPAPPQTPEPPAKARAKLPDLHDPKILAGVYYGGVLAVAVTGGTMAATSWLGWPWPVAAVVVGLAELGGVFMMVRADLRRRLGEKAYGYLILSAAIACGAVALNWFGHADHMIQAAVFAGFSATGYLTWVLNSGDRRRDQLRADKNLPPPPPSYGIYQYLRHPFRTMAARDLARKHPELGLYGSIEAIQLRPKIRPLLVLKLTQIHGKEGATALIELMDAKGMVDMMRKLIDFDQIAARFASEINDAYIPPAPAPIDAARGRASARSGRIAAAAGPPAGAHQVTAHVDEDDNPDRAPRAHRKARADQPAGRGNWWTRRRDAFYALDFARLLDEEGREIGGAELATGLQMSGGNARKMRAQYLYPRYVEDVVSGARQPRAVLPKHISALIDARAAEIAARAATVESFTDEFPSVERVGARSGAHAAVE